MINKTAISQVPESVPELLFHYTKSKGLIGIIKEGKIRITRIDYLNDSSELQLAFDYIRDEIKQQLKGIEKKRTDNELNHMMRDLEFIDPKRPINICIASFTKRGNQLSQWRGYCEVGNGYSLGFDGIGLKNLVLEYSLLNGKHYRLCPCEYKEKEQRRLIKDLVNSTPIEDFLFQKEALSLAPTIKSDKFEEEDEWRLISPPLTYKGAEFREGKSSIIPYWQFDLRITDTLRKIYIGPTPEPELSKSALQGLLIKKNIFGPYDISYCGIPLR